MTKNLRKTKKTFNLSSDSVEKIGRLRHFFNDSYDGTLERLIENAFLNMGKEINLSTGNDFSEKAVHLAHQVQFLTLQLEELKKSFGLSFDELNNKLNSEIEKNQKRSERDLKKIMFVEKWIEAKDKPFYEKYTNFVKD